MAKRKSKKGRSSALKQGLIVLGILVVLAVAFVIIRIVPGAKTSGDAVAYVNGVPITSAEFNQIKGLLAQNPQTAISDSELLDQLINKELLVQAAKTMGITISDEQFQIVMSNYYLMAGSTEENFKTLLAEQNVSFETFRQDMMQRLLIAKYLNATINPLINVSEDSIKNVYLANPALYNQPEKVSASHILVEKKDQADTLLAQLKAGADFSEVARNNSIDSSAPSGGELGWFAASDMVPAFSQAAFSMQIGEISGVVQTQYGFHIIKVLNKTAARIVPLEEASPQIEMALTAQMQNTFLLQNLQELRGKADIKNMLTAQTTTQQPTQTSLYTDTKKDICYEDGKPIVRMFSTSSCPHCKWVKPAFEAVAKEYEGRIVAHLWQLDTGDDLLTPEKETAVPEAEKAIFTEFNQKRSVPTLVFGCRYLRIGAVNEKENDIQKEQAEFKQIIDELLAQ